MENELTQRFREHVNKNDIKLRALEKEIGIPYDRMYKWLKGKGNPKPPDDKTIEDWLCGKKVKEEVQRLGYESTPHNDTRDLINHLKETNADLKNERDKLSKRIEELEKRVLGCLAKLEEKQERAYWFEIEAHSIIIGEFDPDGKKKLLQTFYTNAVQRVTAEREKGSLLKSDMTGMQV